MAMRSFDPTDEQRAMVESMVGFGIPQEEICRLIVNPRTGKPINDRTLRRAFKTEIATGEVKAVSTVIGALYKQAVKGNVGAACFFLKNRAGWKDFSRAELTGPGGGPIETKNRQADDRGAIKDLIDDCVAAERARAEDDSDPEGGAAAAAESPGDIPPVGPGLQKAG